MVKTHCSFKRKIMKIYSIVLYRIYDYALRGRKEKQKKINNKKKTKIR